MGLLLWTAVTQFDIPRREVVDALLAMLLVLIAIMALAALSVGFWVGVRRIRSPGPGERSEVDSD